MIKILFLPKHFLTRKIKINILAFLSIILIVRTLTAQEVPYTPFPKYLSWHVWGEKFNNSGFPVYYSINDRNIVIEDKTYTAVNGYENIITGIREEDKRIYAYIPGFGEHLLYDFNLEVGDTIFYNIGMYLNWPLSDQYILFDDYYTHYAVVEEKGTITLKNGSLRNTIRLKTYGNYASSFLYWIEGIGETGNMGLLNPLVIDFLDNGAVIYLICVCESYDAAGCLFYFERPFLPVVNSCPCKPNSIVDFEKSNITLYPNPTSYELRVTGYKLRIENIEIFNVLGLNVVVDLRVRHENDEYVIDISHLQSGIYFLKIDNKIFKIIKT